MSEWPLPPRPGQREVSERLAELLSSGSRVLFTAPTGWGKTMATLAALVRGNLLPAVWMVRSLTLGERVGEDAALWRLTAFTAAGRERTCPLAEELGGSVHDYCRYFRFKCRYARPPPLTLQAVSYEELVELGAREGFCPYYAQDMVRADIIVQSYYRRVPRIARSFVIDEAHNVLMPRERCIRLSQLVEAIDEARRLGASEKLVRALSAIVRYALIRDGPLDPKLYLDSVLEEELREVYLEALSSGRARCMRVLVDLNSAAAAYIEGEKIRVFRPQRQFSFRPALFTSATLPEGAGRLLQVDAEVRVPWRKRLRALIVEHLTTRYDEYDAGMALQYRRLLIDVAKEYRRVLAFAASERVARDLRGAATYYEAMPPPSWEGVALFRARSRFSEGIDLPADAVVLLGCPYLPPGVCSRLAKTYRAMGLQEPVKMAIDAPMLITTLQCVGRAARSPSDEPLVVLADERYRRYIKELEPYLEVA